MPTHALLGATGSTGAAVLRAILSSRQQKSRESQEEAKEPLALNIFVRNEAKLHSLFSDLPVFSTTTTTTTTSPTSSSLPPTHEANFRIHLFIGPISDLSLSTSCLRNAEVIYNCIGTNSLRKNETLEVSTAHKIITALEDLQREQDQNQSQEKRKVPTILWNRTIGLNPKIRNPVPKFVEGILEWAVGWALDDMRSAQEIYSAAANAGLLRLICIDAPKLFGTSGAQKTGYELVSQARVRTGLYYGDLGDAMVEVARKERRDGILRDATVEAIGVGAKRQVEVNLFVVMGSVLALLGRGVLVRVFGIYI